MHPVSNSSLTPIYKVFVKPEKAIVENLWNHLLSFIRFDQRPALNLNHHFRELLGNGAFYRQILERDMPATGFATCAAEVAHAISLLNGLTIGRFVVGLLRNQYPTLRRHTYLMSLLKHIEDSPSSPGFQDKIRSLFQLTLAGFTHPFKLSTDDIVNHYSALTPGGGDENELFSRQLSVLCAFQFVSEAMIQETCDKMNKRIVETTDPIAKAELQTRSDVFEYIQTEHPCLKAHAWMKCQDYLQNNRQALQQARLHHLVPLLDMERRVNRPANRELDKETANDLRCMETNPHYSLHARTIAAINLVRMHFDHRVTLFSDIAVTNRLHHALRQTHLLPPVRRAAQILCYGFQIQGRGVTVCTPEQEARIATITGQLLRSQSQWPVRGLVDSTRVVQDIVIRLQLKNFLSVDAYTAKLFARELQGNELVSGPDARFYIYAEQAIAFDTNSIHARDIIPLTKLVQHETNPELRFKAQVLLLKMYLNKGLRDADYLPAHIAREYAGEVLAQIDSTSEPKLYKQLNALLRRANLRRRPDEPVFKRKRTIADVNLESSRNSFGDSDSDNEMQATQRNGWNKFLACRERAAEAKRKREEELKRVVTK